MKTVKNVPASIKQKLLNKAKAEKRPFNEILQYYAMERFLYRLSLTNHVDCYILKGALMLRVWNSPESRPTKDIDMLAKTENSEENIISQIHDILYQKVDDDGLTFDFESINTERITEDADYKGIRLNFLCFLGNTKINMKIDIGFGDTVFPEPKKEKLPTILNHAPPILFSYSRESAVAEKFEAMIKHGYLNSRMKDFYDIWLLSRMFQFELQNLKKAVTRTFKQRGTEINHPIEAFTSDYISSHRQMWSAFRKRLNQENIPISFEIIVKEIAVFLNPVIKQANSEMIWNAKGAWKKAQENKPE